MRPNQTRREGKERKGQIRFRSFVGSLFRSFVLLSSSSRSKDRAERSVEQNVRLVGCVRGGRE